MVFYDIAPPGTSFGNQGQNLGNQQVQHLGTKRLNLYQGQNFGKQGPNLGTKGPHLGNQGPHLDNQGPFLGNQWPFLGN